MIEYPAQSKVEDYAKYESDEYERGELALAVEHHEAGKPELNGHIGDKADRKGAYEDAGLVDGESKVRGDDYTARGDAGQLREYKADGYTQYNRCVDV